MSKINDFIGKIKKGLLNLFDHLAYNQIPMENRIEISCPNSSVTEVNFEDYFNNDSAQLRIYNNRCINYYKTTIYDAEMSWHKPGQTPDNMQKIQLAIKDLQQLGESRYTEALFKKLLSKKNITSLLNSVSPQEKENGIFIGGLRWNDINGYYENDRELDCALGLHFNYNPQPRQPIYSNDGINYLRVTKKHPQLHEIH